MKKYYLVATCEGNSPRDLDDNIIRVLQDPHIHPINISLAIHKFEGTVIYTATLLYEHIK